MFLFDVRRLRQTGTTCRMGDGGLSPHDGQATTGGLENSRVSACDIEAGRLADVPVYRVDNLISQISMAAPARPQTRCFASYR